MIDSYGPGLTKWSTPAPTKKAASTPREIRLRRRLLVLEGTLGP
jgi:hypothetical protein